MTNKANVTLSEVCGKALDVLQTLPLKSGWSNIGIFVIYDNLGEVESLSCAYVNIPGNLSYLPDNVENDVSAAIGTLLKDYKKSVESSGKDNFNKLQMIINRNGRYRVNYWVSIEGHI